MLVILTQNQLLSPRQVCQTCLLADCQGQPRWQPGHLRCGRRIATTLAQQPENQKPENQQAEQYQCRMGFRVANIGDYTLDDTPAG